MAQPRQRNDGDLPAPETAPTETGRQSIHGDNSYYGDRVARRAYELYLERGGGDGRDFDDWLTAERELTNGHDRPGDPE